MWVVSMVDSHLKYAVGMYDVVPEASLGTIAVIAALFLAFGAFAVKRIET